MSTGWLVFGLIGAVVLGSGFVLVSAIMRAVWSQRERESLTSDDLCALEDSAVMLVEQIKTEADRSIAELDSRCAVLRELIGEADRKIETLRTLEASAPIKKPAQSKSRVPKYANEREAAGRNEVLDLASRGVARVEIARTTGLDLAEVNLMLSLGGVNCN